MTCGKNLTVQSVRNGLGIVALKAFAPGAAVCAEPDFTDTSKRGHNGLGRCEMAERKRFTRELYWDVA